MDGRPDTAGLESRRPAAQGLGLEAAAARGWEGAVWHRGGLAWGGASTASCLWGLRFPHTHQLPEWPSAGALP